VQGGVEPRFIAARPADPELESRFQAVQDSKSMLPPQAAASRTHSKDASPFSLPWHPKLTRSKPHPGPGQKISQVLRTASRAITIVSNDDDFVVAKSAHSRGLPEEANSKRKIE
jgi:hypothetical protein